MPVPIFDPQGQVRQIPDDQVDAAVNAGGRHAVKILDPKGTARWIPEESAQAALEAGGKIADERSFSRSFYDNTLGGLVQMIVHPQNAVNGMVKDAHDEVDLLRSQGLSKETRQKMIGDLPGPGSTLRSAQEQYDSGNLPGMFGTLAGGVASMAAPEAVKGAVPRAAEVTRNIYPTSKNVLAPEAAARNLGKALVVPTQALPKFLPAAAEEAGTIKAYAKANNLPINSTVDLAKAADATAKAVQGHFDNEILKPNADQVVSVPSDYRGAKLNVEGSRATLGEINSRINAINQELSPAYRKATQGQTNASLVSDADMIAEKRKLTNLLHDKLAEATGLEPEDIASLRQKAGKLRTIADEVNLSANTNTTAAGKAAMGRSDIPTGTKMGLIERGVQALQGGPEIIGNRAVNSAFRQVSPTEMVLPNPRTNPASAPVGYPVQNQVAPASINGTPFVSVADRLDQLLERAKAQRPVRKTR